jgi:antitoxin FitA
MEPYAMNISVKNVPDEIVQRLKERAARHHRSLQGEVMAILEDAAKPRPRLTPLEVWQRARAMGISTPAEAADIIRADRDSR